MSLRRDGLMISSYSPVLLRVSCLTDLGFSPVSSAWVTMHSPRYSEVIEQWRGNESNDLSVT